MIPDHELSDPAVPSEFQGPRNVVKQSLVDVHIGGVALNDASEGLQVKTWTARYTGGQVYLSAQDVAPVAVLTRGGIANLSLAFDRLMRPCIAYQLAGGGAEFWWFDPAQGEAGEYVTLDLGDAITPRVVLDDTAANLLAYNDVVLTYLLGGSLYAREQRDAFAVEYELEGQRLGYRLGQFGKNTGNRLQWQYFKVEDVPQLPDPPAAPLLEVMDSPPLLPEDGELAPFVYIAAGAAYENFPGVLLEISRDSGGTWASVGGIGASSAATIGSITATLAAYASEDPDETNTLAVALDSYGATLEETTDPGLTGGANLAAVGDELLQFRDVAGAAPAYDLDYLLRARFGTTSPEHADGSRFVMMDRDKLLLVPLTMEDVGQELKFRAKAIGGNDYTERTLTFTGASLAS